ncbi:MAG TPA: hypothetical protein VEV83_06190 [Parafilimonas sp.]|nr:hypothetical protein [Parafilimonas sp.]
MKRFLLSFVFITSFTPALRLIAQDADEIIFNQYLPQYNYAGGSFVIDTGLSATKQKRAFLIWANDLWSDSINRYMSLSEYDPNLNFLTEQGNTSEKFGSIKNMFPKKIIKSRFAHVYYVLGYVINSNHKINKLNVYSSPTLYKIDGNTLGLIWSRKINVLVNANNLNTVIEYNDMVETRDKGIVLVGKYAASTRSKESVFATKINSSGTLVWRYLYKTGNDCNEAANSVAENTDGKLSITGYVKKCQTGSFTGNNDVFYLETQANGLPVAGAYTRFVWPSNLNMWADKITRYTSVAGADQLIISGYVDVLSVTGATNRQILVMNMKQNDVLITAHHIGDPKADVCNDLIVNTIAGSASDYRIYLTGQTGNYNPQTSVSADAYFLYAKFNSATGVGGIGELSTFPVTAAPYNNYRSRNGLEIKNAGDYQKFAILATGVYNTGTSSTTYTDVLLRDFADTKASCIKQFDPPVTQFSVDGKSSTVSVDTPVINLYKESWARLHQLNVKEVCNSISIDPNKALNLKTGADNSSQSLQTLRIQPNPAKSVIKIATSDGSLLAGRYNNAMIRIYNTGMQAAKTISVTSAQGSSAQLSIADMRSGVYVVQLIRGDEILGCTFIKE